MYLSRLHPNLLSAQVLTDLADLHRAHQRVMSGFPDTHGPGRQAHQVLWRWDATPSRPPVLYVQSTTPPNWARLPDGYLTSPADIRDLQPLRAVLHQDPRRVLAFRLVANPTRCVDSKTGPDGRRRGRRVPLRDDPARLGWLQRKADNHGFQLADAGGAPNVQITPIPKGTGSRGHGHNRHLITIVPIRYDGQLIVTDPDRFWAALTSGIGRARAYGCGLLSLARP